MKRSISVLAMLVAIGMFSVSYAAEPSAQSPEKAGKSGSSAAQTVKGEVLKIDGENYVVKDATGKEVKLHVNAQTKKQGDIKVGDKIEAQADGTGHATSIKAAK